MQSVFRFSTFEQWDSFISLLVKLFVNVFVGQTELSSYAVYVDKR